MTTYWMMMTMTRMRRTKNGPGSAGMPTRTSGGESRRVLLMLIIVVVVFFVDFLNELPLSSRIFLPRGD